MTNQTDMPVIESCLHCGGELEIEGKQLKNRSVFYVRCRDCGAKGEECSTADKAIKSYGLHSEQTHREAIAELKEKHSLEYKESMELMQKNFDKTQDIILQKHREAILGLLDEVNDAYHNDAMNLDAVINQLRERVKHE